MGNNDKNREYQTEFTTNLDAQDINIAGFSGQTTNYNPLLMVITEAIKSARDDPKNIQDRKNLLDEKIKNLRQEKSNLDFTDKTFKYFSNLLVEKGASDKNDREQLARILAGLRHGIELTSKVIGTVGRKIAEHTKQRMEWLSELEKAGVHLIDGFDNSFTDLANTAKMSHDEFAKMLTANSKTIAQMNAININGAQTFSESLNKTVGRFGYSTEEASTALSTYMNNVVNFYSKESLSEKLKNDATTQYLKNLKELSAATGKSVEILTQENQLKENTLFAKKLNAQHPELYQWLKEAGYTDEMIKAFVTGRPSEESVLFQATPEGRRTYAGTQQVVRGVLNGTISKENIGKSLNNVLIRGDVTSAKRRRELMPYDIANIYDLSGGLSKTMAVADLKPGFDMNAAGQVMSESGDTSYVNSFKKYLAEKNRLSNNWNQAVGFSAKWASDFLDIFSAGLRFANGALKGFAGSLIAYSILSGKQGMGFGYSIFKFLSKYGQKDADIKALFKEDWGKLTGNTKLFGKSLLNLTKAANGAFKSLNILGKGFGVLSAALGSFILVSGIAKALGASDRTVTWSGTGASLIGALGMVIGSFLPIGPILGWMIGTAIGGVAGAGLAKMTSGPAISTPTSHIEENYSYMIDANVRRDEDTHNLIKECVDVMKDMRNNSREQTNILYKQSDEYKFCESRI